MVICYFSQISEQWTEAKLSELLHALPESLRIEAGRKKFWSDRQLTVAGKLMLKEVIGYFGMQQLSLPDLKYTEYHRPYFNAAFDFNIAHSENYVICCGTDIGKIGVDIEEIKPISLDDYTNHFTTNEWQIIRSSGDEITSFFEFWTRKEAIIKAIGTGVYTPLSSIDVAQDKVIYNKTTYHIQKLHITAGYQCHLACTESTGGIACFQHNF